MGRKEKKACDGKLYVRMRWSRVRLKRDEFSRASSFPPFSAYREPFCVVKMK